MVKGHQRAVEKLAYFLFGGFAVELNWLSRPNSFEFEESLLTFVAHGLIIICTMFRDDWTKIVIGEVFRRFLT